jgi:hypothetical protein
VLRARFITTGLAALVAMAIAPALATAAPASFVDDDFAGGTADANTQVVAPGSVQLKPTFDFDFSGSALPTGWAATPWDPPTNAGMATVGGGQLSVDGARFDATPTYGPNRTLAFRATFTGDNAMPVAPDPFQNVGFGTDLNNPPWAIFSTGGGSNPTGLYARTNDGTNPEQTTSLTAAPLNIDPLVPHDYRIEWSATDVKYYVENALVATHPVTFAMQLRPIVSDVNVNSRALKVDSLKLSPGSPTGSFDSRVFAATGTVTAWGALTPTAIAPAGTAVAYKTRSGATPTPDASWSAWQDLGAGGAIQSPVRRYLQYQATLTSTGPATPSLDKVEVAYDVAATPPAGGGTTPPAGGTTPPPSGGGPVVSPARDRSAPKVVLSPRSLRVSRTGKVTFRVKCPRTEQRCKVALQLKRGRITAASKSVTIRGGKTVKVTLRLRRSARTYLSTHARLKVTAVTVARDTAGNRAIKRVKVTLRAPVRA